MGSPEHLVCFHCTVTRLPSGESDAEEETISEISWVVVDVKSNQPGSVHRCVVKSGLSGANEALKQPTNKSLVTSEAQQLGDALEKFDNFVEKTVTCSGERWNLVTDGQFPLRHYLHLEASRKKTKLSQHFYSFYDLRKEVRKALKHDSDYRSLEEVASHCRIDANNNSPAGLEHCKLMASVVQYLVTEGHKFKDPEKISSKYEPGACLGPVLDDTIIRARGLPWQASDQDVANFFKGLNIVRGGIAFCLNAQGRRNGEAFIRFEKGEHREFALKRHKHHLGTRYIEVYRATAQDFLKIVKGPVDVTQIAANFVSNKAEVIIRMRGLPFNSKESDVIEFFEEDAPVFKSDEGILIVRNNFGKATGDAFVLFETEEHGHAALRKHRCMLGSRYVELFRSSQSEVQQVLNSYSNLMHNFPPIMFPPLPHHPPFHPPFLIPGLGVNGMNTKDCLRLRGLPFSATVQDVLDFLKEHAAFVVPGGVHMVYNTQGRPSGDAYVQLVSPECAKSATTDLHRQHMGERYIEVFPCSGVDIAAIITSSTMNQNKMTSPNNTPYSHPCSYPMTNGVVTSPNGTHMNGHTDTVGAATSACRSPTGLYVPHSPTYFNCIIPQNGIGGGNVSYYPPASANFRMRMSPYLPQPYEVMPLFQGYQIADYGR
ncbi:epithelial splicing regulatory protein 1-like isoform X2 [Pocillopora damicornis]|uniref:epithelial splicing regulatory protein 1-like isoform X2 n=1 Tax=Pocillopora damicornis TaxID=46731 RepID=UPI000F553778|nr:epithelial splicing regulatory protein 1-like isoform X2 [Pocillopora damicornis]